MPTADELTSTWGGGLLVRGNVVARHIPYPLVPRLFPGRGTFHALPGSQTAPGWFVAVAGIPAYPEVSTRLNARAKPRKLF